MENSAKLPSNKPSRQALTDTPRTKGSMHTAAMQKRSVVISTPLSKPVAILSTGKVRPHTTVTSSKIAG